MEIKVLGTGCCGNCNTTAALIEKTAQAKGVKIELSKVEDMKEFLKFGVMSTPAVVIDGKVVHSGSVPTSERVEQWLTGAGH